MSLVAASGARSMAVHRGGGQLGVTAPRLSTAMCANMYEPFTVCVGVFSAVPTH